MTSRALLLVSIFFMSACSGASTLKPEATPGSGDSVPSNSVSSDSVPSDSAAANVPQPDPPTSECPAAFSTPSAGPCAGSEECTYDEGTCRCVPSTYCGGVDPGPDYQAPPPHWRCSYHAHVMRPDGCPGGVVEAGAPCEEEGKFCSWGDCCMTVQRCVEGAWSPPDFQCPP